MTRERLGKRVSTWFNRANNSGPSQEDVEHAISALSELRKLVYFEGHVGSNIGFGATISFNPLRHGGANDFIEVALSEIAFRFEPREAEGWCWSDSVKDFVLGNDREVGVTTDEQLSRRSSQTVDVRSKAAVDGAINLGLLKGRASAEQQLGASRSAESASQRSIKRSMTEFDHWAQMTRPEGMFGLRLASPGNDDLVRLNPHLERLPVLHPPDVTTLKEDDVRVVASVQPRGELRHALRIVGAAGKWARQTESRNKQVISELIISKALGSPVRVWPPKRTRP